MPVTPPQKNPVRLAPWGIAAVTVLIAGLLFALQPDYSADPRGLVHSYLKAARAGDVERALSIAGSRPEGESARFLKRRAAESDWEVAAVKTIPGKDPDTTTIRATIVDDSGERISHDITVRAQGGRWRMVDPFVKVAFAKSPLWYAQVGDVRDRFSENTTYLLLPGAYEFYPDGKDLVELKPDRRLLLPGAEPVRIDPRVDELTAKGATAATKAIEKYIDDCAETAKNLWVDDCPFSTNGNVDDRTEYQYFEDPHDISWKVKKYPHVTVEPGAEAFTVTDDRPGTITVRGTATEEVWENRDIVPKGKVKFAVDCQIQARWLHAGITADGTVKVRHVGGENWRPGDFPGCSLDTCRG